MNGRADISLLKKAGSVGRRIATDVVVSLIATLCVSLIVANWTHKDVSHVEAGGAARQPDITGSIASRAAPAATADVRQIAIVATPAPTHASVAEPSLPTTNPLQPSFADGP